MDIDLIKNLDEQLSEENDTCANNISADWLVDNAGNTYKGSESFQANLVDLSDEFNERSSLI